MLAFFAHSNIDLLYKDYSAVFPFCDNWIFGYIVLVFDKPVHVWLLGK